MRDSAVYRPTLQVLRGLLAGSAGALGGIRRSGERKYFPAVGKSKKVSLGPKRFAVLGHCNSRQADYIVGSGVSQVEALVALRQYAGGSQELRDQYQVAPAYASLTPS